ncbi:MAG: hypothetical protein ACKOFL_04395 [Actinomycetota bacterium]
MNKKISKASNTDWIQYYFKSTSGVVGLFLVLIMVTLSISSALNLAPIDPLEQNPIDALKGPNGN